jgi:hypothetical protein
VAEVDDAIVLERCSSSRESQYVHEVGPRLVEVRESSQHRREGAGRDDTMCLPKRSVHSAGAMQVTVKPLQQP